MSYVTAYNGFVGNLLWNRVLTKKGLYLVTNKGPLKSDTQLS